jgi:thiol-disulfide isomerase/thioredoxin
MTEVEIVSAAWCKRCHTIKPDVEALCKAAGTVLKVVDFEEMEEEEKAVIKSLPTIRMRLGPEAPWASYTATTLDEWKAAIATAVLGQVSDTDF